MRMEVITGCTEFFPVMFVLFTFAGSNLWISLIAKDQIHPNAPWSSARDQIRTNAPWSFTGAARFLFDVARSS